MVQQLLDDPQFPTGFGWRVIMATGCRPVQDEWLALIRAEYREIPGLCLTKPQARRLWGLDQPTCDAVLGQLEAAKFLRRTPGDMYVMSCRDF
jgi:hypothetical protein